MRQVFLNIVFQHSLACVCLLNLCCMFRHPRPYSGTHSLAESVTLYFLGLNIYRYDSSLHSLIEPILFERYVVHCTLTNF
jgi:hypothetical protein